MVDSNDNSRSDLESLLRHIGLVAENHIKVSERKTGEQKFVATVTIVLPSGQKAEAEGEESVGKKETLFSACKNLLESIRPSHPYYFQPWESIRVEAQAGDALIKLAAYLSADLTSAKNASTFLQTFESNKNLASVFDFWHQNGDPFLSVWGEHLSEERKSTLVETWVWRRYGQNVVSQKLRDDLSAVLADISSGANAVSE